MLKNYEKCEYTYIWWWLRQVMIKKFVSIDKAEQNFWQKLNKSRKTRQEQKTLIYSFE